MHTSGIHIFIALKGGTRAGNTAGIGKANESEMEGAKTMTHT